ncbi:MAG TPA: cellulose synthase family protein [Vicinamibacterales bacterium]|nr:cellulose synthase family protein [Vicinamibacterales bacterium]
MTPAETLTLLSYFFVLSILGLYGWHRYFLVYQYMKNKDRVPGPAPRLDEWPVVTVQLPIYNEMYVVDRLIDAICDLDYPQDKLEIQVLDDSTDETREIAELAVRRYAQRGFDIKYIHRVDRTGFKAGALDAALKVARGEFIAIFDADFVPSSDFLKRTVGYFSTDDKLAVVQARWGHLNHNYSLLTKVQAVMLDGHFVLEHGGRNRSGCFFNFNGTAGVWRRVAIGDGGGWQHDTLTEDLDLSYRTQLRGWRFLFVPDLVAPAELPVEMNAFKSQQHRWAKGSIQTCRKVLPFILVSDLPTKVKMEAFFHLTANFNYLLMIALSVLMFPAMVVRYEMGWTEMLLIDIPLFLAATLSVFNFYLISQREAYPDWKSRVKYLPIVMAIGIGLAVNNAKAVLEAMFGDPGEFTRTPKYGIEKRADDWHQKKYHQSMPIQPLVEFGLGLYFTATVIYALSHEIYGTLPFLALFQFGFLYMGGMSILQQFGHDGALEKAPQVASGK